MVQQSPHLLNFFNFLFCMPACEDGSEINYGLWICIIVLAASGSAVAAAAPPPPVCLTDLQGLDIAIQLVISTTAALAASATFIHLQQV